MEPRHAPPPLSPPLSPTQATEKKGLFPHEKSARTIFLLAITIVMAIWFLPAIFINWYVLGGINFPNVLFARIYFFGGAALLYGAALTMPILAGWLLAKRNIGWLAISLLLAIPIVLQVLAFVGHSVLGDIYGFVV